MKQITSFTINHDYLKPGMYISRVDGDVITYDLRMKLPNNPAGDYLEDNALHTFEHLFATYVRNTPLSDGVVYVGPMGCRTGFYFLTRNTVSGADAIRLVQETLQYVLDFTGEIPGRQAAGMRQLSGSRSGGCQGNGSGVSAHSDKLDSAAAELSRRGAYRNSLRLKRRGYL